MAIDVTGGLGDELEQVWASQPDDPDARESINAWIWDDGPDVALPRIGIEAVADQWETHDVNVNLAFGDGRVFTRFAPGDVHDPIGDDGRPSILGAGPLRCEVGEPYRHLRISFDGELAATTVEAQLGGSFPGEGEPTAVSFQVDLRPAAPPWMNGALRPEAKAVLDTQEEGDLVGHPWRFEQLCRATGHVQIGDRRHEISGGANRIRRQGIRRLAAFRGHVWQAALFPSGKGFGSLVFPDREDGRTTYNEGYLFDGDGPLVPARVVEAPWLRRPVPGPQPADCVIEADDGRTVHIEGRTTTSTFMVMPPHVGGGMQLQQTIASYRWDGEEANGMLERSTPPAGLEA